MTISNKPVVWSLFAGGGMVAAFLAAAMIFITGIAVPLGLLDAEALAYQRILAVVGNPTGRLLLFGFVFLLLWHAAHRLKMTWHDLGLGAGRAASVIFYLSAAAGSLAAGLVLLSI